MAQWADYLRASLAVACATGAGLLLRDHVDIADLAMIYLVAIASVAAFLGRGPSFAASVLAVLAFDFFFVPPFFTFAVSQIRHVLTFAVMLGAGITISSLSDRLRRQSLEARERERRTAALLALSRALSAARDVDAIARVATEQVRDVLGARASIATDARPPSDTVFPLAAGEPALALVLDEPVTDAEARRTLESFAAQIALAIERARFASEAKDAQVRAETEEMRSSLLSSVSHDLRTPIGTILGSATALIGSDVPSAERGELLVAMRDEAARLERLVSNLLEMTRVESRHLTVTREWVPLEELVGAVMTRFEERLAGRDVRIDLPRDLPLVAVDPVLFEQVLINLVDNALKHTPAGSPMEISARATEGGVVLEVADRGPGVPQRAFEKFVRGADTRGVGLGLAICRGIVTAHGGTIDARPREGGGSIFRIALASSDPPPVLDEAAQ